MFHYFDSLTNTRGDALVGLRVRVLVLDTETVVPMYADESGTPIISVSGIADAVLSDEDGNFTFYVDDGIYNLEFASSDGVPYKVVRYVNMTASQGPQGDTGAAANTYTTLAAFKAGPAANGTQALAGTAIDGTFFFETTDAPYTADDVNIIEADDTPLTTGAWVRQGADKVSARNGISVQETLDRVALVNIAALVALPKVKLTDGASATLLGFYTEGDGGGGSFRWDAASAATAISGMVVASVDGGNGRWFRRIENGVITDRMAGAKVDGVTIDDPALIALAAYVSAYPVRNITFASGTRAVMALGETVDPFVVSGVTGLVLTFPNCEFQIGRDQNLAGVSSNLFRFTDCEDVTVVGVPRIRGNMTVAYMSSVGSASGTIAFQFLDNCSGASLNVDAEGIQSPFLFTRTPRLMVSDRIATRIVAGGAGYVVGEVISLPSIGLAAQVAATWTVATVSGGVVTGLTQTNQGRYPSNTVTVGLPIAQAGFATTASAAGTGLTIMPYIQDYDIATMTRNCIVQAKSRICFYGGQCQRSLCDSTIHIDADFVYRSLVYFGGTRGNNIFVRQRNVRNDAVAGGSDQGLGSQMRLYLKQEATTVTTFASNNSLVRCDYGGGMAAECDWDVTYEVDVGSSQLVGSVSNCFGAFLEIDKSATNGSDVTHPRGHIGKFTIRGSIRGRGRLDSGIGAANFGTNLNVTDAAWTGEQMEILLADGLKSVGGSHFVFNAKSLKAFHVGSVNLDGPIGIDYTNSGIRFEPAGRVTVAPGAVFLNRFVTSSYFSAIGDILVAANFPVSANHSGASYHAANGTGTALVASLPVATTGQRFKFINGITAAGSEMHLSPQPGDRFNDGATQYTAGKDWRLTDLAATIEIVCIRANWWSFVNKNGAQSIEP